MFAVCWGNRLFTISSDGEATVVLLAVGGIDGILKVSHLNQGWQLERYICLFMTTCIWSNWKCPSS